MNKVGPGEVGVIEFGLTKADRAEVWDNIRIVRPPFIPVLNPLEKLDVFWIGGSIFGSILRIFAPSVI